MIDEVSIIDYPLSAIFLDSLPFLVNVSIRSTFGVDTRIYFLPDNPFLPRPRVHPHENWILENERKKILSRLIHSTVFDVAKDRPPPWTTAS